MSIDLEALQKLCDAATITAEYDVNLHNPCAWVNILCMQTINVTTWGVGAIGSFSVRVQEGETSESAASRSIERRSKLQWCAGPRRDGITSEGRAHFQGALGRPCKGGGYEVVSEIWFALDVGPASAAAAALGRLGGSVTSKEKAKAARANGAKGGRPKAKRG